MSAQPPPRYARLVAADSLTDKYIACAIESVIEMEVVRDFALIRGLVYPTSAFTEMRVFAGEVHNVDIDYLVGQAHDNCRGVVRNNGAPVGASVHRGTFEASLLGSFMWWVWRLGGNGVGGGAVFGGCFGSGIELKFLENTCVRIQSERGYPFEIQTTESKGTG